MLGIQEPEMKSQTHAKFDVVIGNPPYQEDRIGGSATQTPIYHDFIENSYASAMATCLIAPARFLFDAGMTPKMWNQKMLSEPRLDVKNYEPESADLFPGTDIKGGVAVTYRDINKNFGSIETFIPEPLHNSIFHKVDHGRNLAKHITGQDSYRLTEKALDEHTQIEEVQSKGHARSIQSNAFETAKVLISVPSEPKPQV
jgi:hypothetical protein